MKTIINSTKNFTRKQAINSKNGIALKDMNGSEVHVSGLAVLEDSDSPEGTKEVGVIIAEDGMCYTCISSGAIDVIGDCIDLVNEGEEVTLKVDVRTSKGGREFIALIVL